MRTPSAIRSSAACVPRAGRSDLCSGSRKGVRLTWSESAPGSACLSALTGAAAVRNPIDGRIAARRPKATVTRAVAVLEEQAEASEVEAVWEDVHTFEVDGHFSVQVEVWANVEAQIVRITAPRDARLVLHWGLEGGVGYRAGWWLPQGPASRPRGTVMYKDCALQTRFHDRSTAMEGRLHGDDDDDYRTVWICLEEEDLADRLNFVLKDEDTGVWHDSNGGNFVVKLNLSDDPSLAVQDTGCDHNQGSGEQNIPAELCGVWTYKRWERAGFPTRSDEESHFHYQGAVGEIKAYLAGGWSMDEMWRLARSGEFL